VSADGARFTYAVDVDGDGRVDVLSASQSDNKIAWYRNEGGSPPTWTNYTISTTASYAWCVYAADVDGDGRMDVLSASALDDKIAWYRNEGGSPPSWTPHNISTTANGARTVYATDMDGDGLVDVLSASTDDNKIAWYRNGGGSPPSWTAYNISTAALGPGSLGAYYVFAADVDSDGRVDVVSSTDSTDEIVWYKNGGGSPPTWTSHLISNTADGGRGIFATDMDGDGRVDVLSASYLDDKIAWYKNGGGSPPSWTSYTISTTADGARSVHAADVDGDGRMDVLSASMSDNKVAWYKNGGGSPPSWIPFNITTAAYGANCVFTMDVDGDRRVDVVSTSYNDDKIAVYINNMCPRGTSGPGGYAPCTPCPAGRYNNDSMQSSCIACSAGRYGAAPGAVNVTSGCAGACSPGYMCPPGSASSTAVACPAGYFSGPGASTCSPCVAGTFTSRTGQASCTTCPSYTTSTVAGATACLPTCPGSGQLAVGYATGRRSHLVHVVC
jgi:hypothetical protein